MRQGVIQKGRLRFDGTGYSKTLHFNYCDMGSLKKDARGLMVQVTRKPDKKGRRLRLF